MQVSPTRDLELDQIRIDGGTQSRVTIDENVVARYAECIDDLPPIVVFFDGTTYWLVDGFHRLFAHRKANRKTIVAACRAGTRREAILKSLGENSTHGLPRTDADKVKAVRTLLDDPEWCIWSDREIAETCAVSHPFVAKQRKAPKPAEGVGNVSNPPSEPAIPAPQVPAEVQEKVAQIRESGGTPRLMKQGDKTVAFDASKRTVPQKTEEKEAPAAADPEKPWGQFEAKIRNLITKYRALNRELGEVLEYDADTKRLNGKWTKGYSFLGTIDCQNQFLRALEKGLPVSEDGKGGYITGTQQQVGKRINAA